jgi:RND family efflux transporter MFP subunit
MSAKKASVLLKLVIVLVLLGAGVAAVVFFLRPVAKVVTVARGVAQDIVPGAVVVEAERVSPVASEIEGKILKSTLELNRVVKEGEILVELDSTDIDIEIAHADAELESARKTIAIAKEISDLKWTGTEETLKNTRRSYEEQKNVAQAAMDEAERTFKAAKQAREKELVDNARTLENLDNTLKVARRKKEKMTIRAPLDGTISEVLAYKNDYVSARLVLANIIAPTRRVIAKIGEERFSAIAIGAKATVSFLGLPNQKFAAVVTQKLPTAERETQRYIAYLQVEIPPEKLLPGLTGEVGVIVGEHPDVVLVPRKAMWDGYVFVIDGGRARERKLDTGFMDFNFIEVKSGLQPGDVVIVEEKDKFHQGQRVRPVPAAQ